MKATDILQDLTGRVREAVGEIPRDLPTEVVNAHPAGHPNSLVWLLWHTGRELDVQLSGLTADEEVWTSEGYDSSSGVQGAGESMGFGQTPAQAQDVTAAEAGPVTDYVTAVCDAVDAYLSTLDDADLDAVIDDAWDPPVTRGVRLISILHDAVIHLGQAAYVLGTDAGSSARG
ncbi:Putative membrane protein [Corynebacterium glyciniphilum AJ 3170]|uniref:Putative membrane protein n=1 Tax=Corynebacterium glyciniphilum AJ 3170 TaxID=1404245 RepID=X5DSE3_9CORY|nr:DinB family protein [Corynebacterium glyciniphilum]AHW64214.1 Putative membrane protein [Corynebacterium glyciniphilum AJ 3170]